MRARPVVALASNNRGKIRELEALLGKGVSVVTLADLGLESPEESGNTFMENAIIKARHVYEETGILALADDSGLEVDALNGAPGVRSARYSGENASDAANRSLLVRELKAIADHERSARFVSVIAIASDRGVHTATGVCTGTIGLEERGTNGFGYDALFTLPDGRTMAEISAVEKNQISHRAVAMRAMLPVLLEELGLEMPVPEPE